MANVQEKLKTFMIKKETIEKDIESLNDVLKSVLTLLLTSFV